MIDQYEHFVVENQEHEADVLLNDDIQSEYTDVESEDTADDTASEDEEDEQYSENEASSSSEDEELDVENESFIETQKLRQWAVRNKIRQTALDELLAICRQRWLPDLPRSIETYFLLKLNVYYNNFTSRKKTINCKVSKIIQFLIIIIAISNL